MDKSHTSAGPPPPYGQQPPPPMAGYSQPSDYYSQPPPPPPQQQQQSSTTVVIARANPVTVVNGLGDGPMTMTCPHCSASIVTRVQYVNGNLVWLSILILIVLG